MNTTTNARFFIMLMLTATAAIATASAVPDQAASMQINPIAIYHGSHAVANDTHSIYAPQQRIALLIRPTAARPQTGDWDGPQPALSSERQMPAVKTAAPDDGAIVLATVSVHPHLTMIQWIGHKVNSLLP
jgi:hypothetical protein